jgi:hypothetical protein
MHKEIRPLQATAWAGFMEARTDPPDSSHPAPPLVLSVGLTLLSAEAAQASAGRPRERIHMADRHRGIRNGSLPA